MKKILLSLVLATSVFASGNNNEELNNYQPQNHQQPMQNFLQTFLDEAQQDPNNATNNFIASFFAADPNNPLGILAAGIMDYAENLGATNAMFIEILQTMLNEQIPNPAALDQNSSEINPYAGLKDLFKEPEDSDSDDDNLFT